MPRKDKIDVDLSMFPHIAGIYGSESKAVFIPKNRARRIWGDPIRRPTHWYGPTHA